MLDDLDSKYRLSFLVGEIVRNDVGVESEIRMLWRKLFDAGLPIGEMQRDFGRLIPQIRKVLVRPEVPEVSADRFGGRRSNEQSASVAQHVCARPVGAGLLRQGSRAFDTD